ncbi:MAG: hypothetical protein HQL37_03130 [Alphaproteobacteria bacterium]|nr:hypothetical protein [Alphaproteobacteria bacterium]
MNAPADCRLIGRWRIVEADQWDQDYLDLVEPAYITFGADGHGEFAFGALNAGLTLEYARTIIFFRWSGSDEGTEITGTGSAELNDDGVLEIELSFDDGDDAVLRAQQDPSLIAG